MFIEVPLFQETFLALKNSWLPSGKSEFEETLLLQMRIT